MCQRCGASGRSVGMSLVAALAPAGARIQVRMTRCRCKDGYVFAVETYRVKAGIPQNTLIRTKGANKQKEKPAIAARPNPDSPNKDFKNEPKTCDVQLRFPHSSFSYRRLR